MMKQMGVGQGTTAMKRFRQWWKDELEGQPHKPIILGTEQGDVAIEKISMSNDEMQFAQYSLWLLTKIMVVYKMQPAILGVGIKESNPGNLKTEKPKTVSAEEKKQPAKTPQAAGSLRTSI